MLGRASMRTALCVALCAIVSGAVVVGAPLANAAVSIKAFTFDSDPGDPMGDGLALTLTPSNGLLNFHVNNKQISMRALSTGAPHDFSALITPPTGQSFLAGTTYTTLGTADAADAGMQITDLRSCVTYTGTLTILEFVTSGGAVTAFAAQFVQHCNGATPALYGELRWKSSVSYAADTVDPTMIDFGPQGLLPSEPKDVTIVNTGDRSISLGSVALSGPQSGDFTMSSDNCSGVTLTVGSPCMIGVVFTPSESGTRAATLSLTADTFRGQIQVVLSGVGVKKQTSVTLSASATRILFPGRVELTAHLTEYTTTVSKHLDIYATPYGGTQTLVASGDVDASGDLSFHLRPKALISVVAQFPGDAQYDPASSATLSLRVYPIVRGNLAGFYATRGSYRLYHYSSACPRRGSGCPRYVVSVNPNHGGEAVDIQVQARKAGRAWQNVLGTTVSLNLLSKRTIAFVYGKTSVTKFLLRVRMEFTGDRDHLARRTHWSYFRITS
jgi:hypothetical protein